MELYPFKSNFLDLHGVKYHYLDEGSGQPIVMVHGNPTWSFYFRELVLALRDTYRVIVPDHIGCGLSDKPSDAQYSYTLKQRFLDLESLLTHLGISKDIVLVMHDWGGMIGTLYASKHPEAVERFVVMNTAAFRMPKTKKLPLALKLSRIRGIGDFLVRRLNLFSRGALWFCAKRKLPKNVKTMYLAPYNSWKNRIAVIRFIQDIPLKKADTSYDLVAQVENNLSLFSDKPCLICWGEKDFVFDHHFLKEWQKHFPQAKVHRFPRAGHYLLEDEGPAIISLLKDFLTT